MLRMIFDWLPFVIVVFFIGLLIFFMRKMGLRRQNDRQASQASIGEHLAEAKKTNELLTRIATALEARSSGER